MSLLIVHTERAHRSACAIAIAVAVAASLVVAACGTLDDRRVPAPPVSSASSGGGSGGDLTGSGGSDAGGGGSGGQPHGAPTCPNDIVDALRCGDHGLADADPHTLYACEAGGAAEVVEACEHGCIHGSADLDDFCALVLPACPTKPLIKYGVCPDASDQMQCLGIGPGTITQTIGDFASSAGTHHQDGTIDGKPYCAATDLSVKTLTNPQVKVLVDELAAHGFAAFFRDPGKDGWPATEARHIHMIYVGVPMKASLKAQVEDWLAGLNGLTSHAPYTFYQASSAKKALIRTLFDTHN